MTFGVYIGLAGLLMVILLWVLLTSSHDDVCMMCGRCWYCHLASASLCGTLESGRLNKADVQAILG